MEKKETVISFIKAIEKGQMEAGDYLDDNFSMNVPFPIQFGKAQVLTFAHMATSSVPDLNLAVSNIVENGDNVSVSIKASGSYQKDFMVPGLLSLPAQGQKIDLPDTKFDFVVQNNKIKEIKLPNLPKMDANSMMNNNGFNLPGNN